MRKLLLGVLICCLPAADSLADNEAANGFVLLVDDNAPGLEALLEGNAVEAADKATRTLRDPAASATLRCAALIAERALDAAADACDQAVDAAEVPITTGQNPHGHTDRDALAMAYSNRAVLHWLKGDVDAAEADMRRAGQQNRHIDSLAHNRRLVTEGRLAAGER